MTSDPDQMTIFEALGEPDPVMTPVPDSKATGDPMGGAPAADPARVPRMGEPGYVPDYVCPNHEDCEEHTFYGKQRCPKWSRSDQRRCRQPLAFEGAPSCFYHGSGNHKQTMAKARLRLISEASSSIERLVVERDSAESSADRQRAANSLLDRVGVVRGINVIGGSDLREVVIQRLMEIRERKELEAAKEEPAEEIVDAEIVEE